MNNNLLLILFNIIIIYISFNLKNNVKYYYTIIFIILISYYIYLKGNIVEGNVQDEIFRSFNELKSNNNSDDLPLDKISKLLELMLGKMTGENNEKGKCIGQFVINKLTNKECGEGFNERIYKVTKDGEDCLHTDLYKEKVPLRSCEYNEYCDTDLDCKTRNCKDRLCAEDLGCAKDMLSGCGYDSCLGLNEGLDDDLYYFDNNECRVDPCNENTYQLCNKAGCDNLSYKYKYNDNRSICERIVQDTDETGLEIGSYLNVLQDFQEENSGCTSDNPEDCKGLCSDFNIETTDMCSIRINGEGEQEPEYICNENSINLGTNSFSFGNKKYPCEIFREDNRYTIRLEGWDEPVPNYNANSELYRAFVNNIKIAVCNILDIEDCISNDFIIEGNTVNYSFSLNPGVITSSTVTPSFDELEIENLTHRVENVSISSEDICNVDNNVCDVGEYLYCGENTPPQCKIRDNECPEDQYISSHSEYNENIQCSPKVSCEDLTLTELIGKSCSMCVGDFLSEDNNIGGVYKCSDTGIIANRSKIGICGIGDIHKNCSLCENYYNYYACNNEGTVEICDDGSYRDVNTGQCSPCHYSNNTEATFNMVNSPQNGRGVVCNSDGLITNISSVSLCTDDKVLKSDFGGNVLRENGKVCEECSTNEHLTEDRNCTPIMCRHMDAIPGYNIDTQGFNLSKEDFSVPVSCNEEYYSIKPPEILACTVDGGEYSLKNDDDYVCNICDDECKTDGVIDYNLKPSVGCQQAADDVEGHNMQCIPRVCTSVPSPKNAIIEELNRTSSNFNVNVTCEEGYYSDGLEAISCAGNQGSPVPAPTIGTSEDPYSITGTCSKCAECTDEQYKKISCHNGGGGGPGVCENKAVCNVDSYVLNRMGLEGSRGCSPNSDCSGKEYVSLCKINSSTLGDYDCTEENVAIINLDKNGDYIQGDDTKIDINNYEEYDFVKRFRQQICECNHEDHIGTDVDGAGQTTCELNIHPNHCSGGIYKHTRDMSHDERMRLNNSTDIDEWTSTCENITNDELNTISALDGSDVVRGCSDFYFKLSRDYTHNSVTTDLDREFSTALNRGNDVVLNKYFKCEANESDAENPCRLPVKIKSALGGMCTSEDCPSGGKYLDYLENYETINALQCTQNFNSGDRVEHKSCNGKIYVGEYVGTNSVSIIDTEDDPCNTAHFSEGKKNDLSSRGVGLGTPCENLYFKLSSDLLNYQPDTYGQVIYTGNSNQSTETPQERASRFNDYIDEDDRYFSCGYNSNDWESDHIFGARTGTAAHGPDWRGCNSDYMSQFLAGNLTEHTNNEPGHHVGLEDGTVENSIYNKLCDDTVAESARTTNDGYHAQVDEEELNTRASAACGEESEFRSYYTSDHNEHIGIHERRNQCFELWSEYEDERKIYDGSHTGEFCKDAIVDMFKHRNNTGFAEYSEGTIRNWLEEDVNYNGSTNKRCITEADYKCTGWATDGDSERKEACINDYNNIPGAIDVESGSYNRFTCRDAVAYQYKGFNGALERVNNPVSIDEIRLWTRAGDTCGPSDGGLSDDGTWEGSFYCTRGFNSEPCQNGGRARGILDQPLRLPGAGFGNYQTREQQTADCTCECPNGYRGEYCEIELEGWSDADFSESLQSKCREATYIGQAPSWDHLFCENQIIEHHGGVRGNVNTCNNYYYKIPRDTDTVYAGNTLPRNPPEDTYFLCEQNDANTGCSNTHPREYPHSSNTDALNCNQSLNPEFIACNGWATGSAVRDGELGDIPSSSVSSNLKDKLEQRMSNCVEDYNKIPATATRGLASLWIGRNCRDILSSMYNGSRPNGNNASLSILPTTDAVRSWINSSPGCNTQLPPGDPNSPQVFSDDEYNMLTR